MTAIPAFPKPVRSKKERKPLKRGARLEAKRFGVRRKVAGARPSDLLAHPKPRREVKTKHGRRERETGFMHFCHARGCELALDALTQRFLEIVHVCRGPVEFAHLSDLKRYDVGDIGAGLCRDEAHRGIDGKEGGKATWYAALTKKGQGAVRMVLANRARGAWEALTPAERARWNEMAEARRAAR